MQRCVQANFSKHANVHYSICVHTLLQLRDYIFQTIMNQFLNRSFLQSILKWRSSLNFQKTSQIYCISFVSLCQQVQPAGHDEVCGPCEHNPKNNGTFLPQTLAGFLQFREILLARYIQCIIELLSTNVKCHNFTLTLYMIHAFINLCLVLNKNWIYNLICISILCCLLKSIKKHL